MAKKLEEDLAAKFGPLVKPPMLTSTPEAEALKKESREVPVGVLKQTICRRGNCPCSYALNLLSEETVA